MPKAAHPAGISRGLDAWLNVPPQPPAPNPIRRSPEREATRLTDELLAAAMRAADHWGDSPEAREQWRQDVLNTPPELHADLLAHLSQTYPRRTKS